MFIACSQRFKSIPPFEPIELPSLTVLIGPNGSGKSQLLAGLHTQHVQCSLFGPLTSPTSPLPPGHPQIVLLRNCANIDVQFGGHRASKLGERFGSIPPTEAMRYQSMYSFQGTRSTLLQGARANLDEALGPSAATILAVNEDPWRLGAAELTRRVGLLPTDTRSERIVETFHAAASALETNRFESGIDSTFFSEIGTAAEEFAVTRLEVTPEMIDALRLRIAAQMFQPNVVDIFGDYRDRVLSNRLDEIQARDEPATTFLDPDKFVAKYGSPPWQIVSDLLAAMALPFAVVPPSHVISEPVRFRLRPTAGGEDLSFDALSSGEQVLLRFAVSLMRPNPRIVGFQRPLLLLLDEMDASLHPEMVQRWLSAVERGIVGELRMSVILTTHSPTTVALTPANSIFAMIEGRPQRVSKQEAINRLTFGVPTLSIDYSGRRQVFCESDTDAAAYEIIYAAVKPNLRLKKQLNFVGTGIRDKSKIVMVGAGEEINTGEAVVRKIVEDLTRLEVTSVFGLARLIHRRSGIRWRM